MTAPGRLDVVRASFPEIPAAGPALARMLLDQVASGERAATLRVSNPGPAVAFGRRDTVSPGYRGAVETAADLGHPGIERISGGRATAYTDRTVVLGFTLPARNPAQSTTERFEWVAGLVADALGSLGVEAVIGEIEGEYCPGRYSISLGGDVKVAGLGQRMIPGAAHVGVVLTIGGSEELREVLVPVYRELGLNWDPGTAGAVSDRLPGVTETDFEEAFLAVLGRWTDRNDRELDPETRSAAVAAAPAFASPGGGRSDHRPGDGG